MIIPRVLLIENSSFFFDIHPISPETAEIFRFFAKLNLQKNESRLFYANSGGLAQLVRASES